MNYLEKIKQFSKINITAICRELNINRSNLYHGRTTEENIKRVYEKIVDEYNKIIQ